MSFRVDDIMSIIEGERFRPGIAISSLDRRASLDDKGLVDNTCISG